MSWKNKGVHAYHTQKKCTLPLNAVSRMTRRHWFAACQRNLQVSSPVSHNRISSSNGFCRLWLHQKEIVVLHPKTISWSIAKEHTGSFRIDAAQLKGSKCQLWRLFGRSKCSGAILHIAFLRFSSVIHFFIWSCSQATVSLDLDKHCSNLTAAH